jgi:hypothetical protein
MVSVIMLVVIGLCIGWIVWMRRRRARAYTAPVPPGGEAPRDLSARCLCARELVLGGGAVCRRHRVLSSGTRARADASSCRWPARRSGTAAARGKCSAARQRNGLSRRPRAIGTGCMARGPLAGGDIMSVQSLVMLQICTLQFHTGSPNS